MNRLLLPLLLLPVCTAVTASAQSEYWAIAPLRFGLEYRMIDVDHQDIHVVVDRSVPLDFFLPNVSPGSRVDVLGLAAGARFGDGDVILRWRVVPLDLDLTRPPWTGGVTLLTYDRTTPREVVADWLAMHAGPAARIRTGSFTIEPAVILRGGLGSRRTGTRVFGHLDDEGSTGFAGSATGRLVIAAADRSMLRMSAGIERLWGGADPQMRSAEASLLLRMGLAWTLDLNGGIQEVEIDGRSQSAGFYGFRLRFIPDS